MLASGGWAGLDLLAQASMALILLDCKMPDMDGFETAVAIRQAGFLGPVIGLTAEITADISDRCLQAGMNEYERKPIYRLASGAPANIFKETELARARNIAV